MIFFAQFVYCHIVITLYHSLAILFLNSIADGLVDLAEERQSLMGLAPCSIPGCNLSKGNIENLGPVGGWGSVIAPLPERLLGLIEGSL